MSISYRSQSVARVLGLDTVHTGPRYASRARSKVSQKMRMYLVIECKSGATADKIWRRDVAQLAHSVSWFTTQYDQTFTATPVLVHRISELANNAAAPRGRE